MKIAPLAEVKDRLSAYIDATRESAIVVTRNGKPVALLTAILEDDDLDSLLLAHDRNFTRLLQEARQRVRTGRYLTSEQFWVELRRRRARRKTTRTPRRRAKASRR
jgi:antitoxin (DNA-binding transcriptional repressor) of toxin-antitoxin stability system